MLTTSGLLSGNKELVSEIIQFFLAKQINPEFHKRICQKLIKKGTERTQESTHIRLGMLSSLNFIFYRDAKPGGHSIDNLIKITLQRMKEKHLVEKLEYTIRGREVYMALPYAKVANQIGIIDNLVFGFEYIIDKYRNAVCTIEPTINSYGDKSIGTGFLTMFGPHSLLVTNYHVIKNARSLVVKDVKENVLPYTVICENKAKDIAILKVTPQLPTNYFQLSQIVKILAPIITIGYPSIPYTQQAYQVYHKGEVNSFIEDYEYNKLFLISAKTSSGNSGSPVIDESGCVIGIITQELFNKAAFQEKGKLPYYAAIPISEFFLAIKNREFWNE